MDNSYTTRAQNGRSALMESVSRGHCASAALLLTHKAKVNESDKVRSTGPTLPMQQAPSCGCLAITH